MPEAFAETVWLSTAYFPPVQYFSYWLTCRKRVIEQYDHYHKQSYRNRCNVLGANGILPLSIPISKGSAHKIHVRDVRIDYGKTWQKNHWKGIESAYRHSPFFEFYQDEMAGWFTKRFEFLLDLNDQILHFLLESLDLDRSYSYSEEFLALPAEGVVDMRERIHPKHDVRTDPSFQSEAYSQVFSDRYGFQPNLSMIDLLFNEGPNARQILEKTSKFHARTIRT